MWCFEHQEKVVQYQFCCNIANKCMLCQGLTWYVFDKMALIWLYRLAKGEVTQFDRVRIFIEPARKRPRITSWVLFLRASLNTR